MITWLHNSIASCFKNFQMLTSAIWSLYQINVQRCWLIRMMFNPYSRTVLNANHDTFAFSAITRPWDCIAILTLVRHAWTQLSCIANTTYADGMAKQGTKASADMAKLEPGHQETFSHLSCIPNTTFGMVLTKSSRSNLVSGTWVW